MASAYFLTPGMILFIIFYLAPSCDIWRNEVSRRSNDHLLFSYDFFIFPRKIRSEEEAYSRINSLPVNCPFSLLKFNTPSHLSLLFKNVIYTQCCFTVFEVVMLMWILQAHILKLWFSPDNLSLWIWLLAQQEELKRWEEKYYFFNPHSAHLVFRAFCGFGQMCNTMYPPL